MEEKIIREIIKEAGVSPGLTGYETMVYIVKDIITNAEMPHKLSHYASRAAATMGTTETSIARRIRSVAVSSCNRYGAKQVRTFLHLADSNDAVTPCEFLFSIAEMAKDRIDAAAEK